MKYQTRDVRLAIRKGNEIIADFKQHTHGKLNLWASITDLSQKYNINVEAHSKFNPGVYNAIVAQLPFSDFSYDDFIEVLMAFQKEWDIPVLTHEFPKKELFNLRFQNATNQLDNTARINEVRKNIARIQTVITQKQKAE